MKGRVLLVLFLLAGSSIAQVAAGRLEQTYATATSSLVSASDLSIPVRARKSFEKANALIQKQEFREAIDKLNQAIAIYPAYSLAYNNLGVLYGRMGDQAREREALQKAVSINNRLPLAYLNLGRMNVASGDFSAAEAALDQASKLDPGDPTALVLLSYAQVMGGRFDEAIATSRRAHVLPKYHAMVHTAAARAFLRKGDAAGAAAELECFLKEQPSGPEADSGRKELASLQATIDARRQTNPQ